MFIVSLENINLDSLETFLVTLGERMDLKAKVDGSYWEVSMNWKA